MQWRGWLSRRRPVAASGRVGSSPARFPVWLLSEERTFARGRWEDGRPKVAHLSVFACGLTATRPGPYRRVAGNESLGWMPSASRPSASGGGRALPSGPLLFTGGPCHHGCRQFAEVATFATDLRPVDPSTLDGATGTGFFPRNHRHDRRSRERSCGDDRGGGKGGDRIGCERHVRGWKKWAELTRPAAPAVMMQRQVSTSSLSFPGP